VFSVTLWLVFCVLGLAVFVGILASPSLSPVAIRLRVAFLLLLAGIGLALLFLLRGPIAQDVAYHAFADTRTLFGVPHALNVISNLPFLIIGLLGLTTIVQRRATFLDPREIWPYGLFFIGVGLTAIGSAYYHLEPTSTRLVWDRLPIAVAFMALFSAVIGERIGVRTGLALLRPLMVLGLGSVLYWTWTDDLRPYYFVQGYPILAIPLMLALFPPRYTRGTDLLIAVAWYAAAKGCELYDQSIYSLLGNTLSGHTLKHLLSGAGAYWVCRMLQYRQPIEPGPSSAPALGGG
jgi:hypothetical protein